ncbi:MAG TPA: hypothetical protein VHC72_13980 [Bryobacteraceae bacterium]|nr:hypothetical protein [Bryobacteraceae bacterium]
MYVSFWTVVSIAASRKRVTLAALAVLLLIGGGAVWLRIEANRAFFDPRLLLSRFPAEDALAISIDFTKLRAAGLLAGSKTALEPDYKQFVDGTGFDYKRDLDSVVASFSRSGNFFIARGRFDWAKLQDYAMRQGGSCYRDLCRLQGSRPERHISFLPLRNNVIALAVSTSDLAATRLTKTGPPVTAAIPSAPVWISVPGAELRRQDALPPQMHYMLSALASAERILITVGPGSAGIEAHMEATCRSEDDARLLASQLRTTTAMIKEALEQDKNAAGDELAAFLTSGTFDQKDRRVTGMWPVRTSLLDALTAGI